MDKIDCLIIQDLLPIYIDNLASDNSKYIIENHINECNECHAMYSRLHMNIAIETSVHHANKKILFYINSLRIWYFMCPFIAFILITLNYSHLLHIYKYFLVCFSIICLSSQFASGLTQYGFDYEQVKLQEDARNKAKAKYNIFYNSPFSIAIPAILVAIIIELPKWF